MTFDIRLLNKAYKEILTLRGKVNSLLKVEKVIKHEHEILSQQDVLYLPKPVLVYLLILKISSEKGADLSAYKKHQKRALNALTNLLNNLNNKKTFLEEHHQIDKNQEIEFIKVESKAPRRVFHSPTHHQMAQEIMRRFKERNLNKE